MLDQMPYSEGLHQVIELAREEAQRQGQADTLPEHLLLGLIRRNEGQAIRILNNLQASPEELRKEMLRIMLGDADNPVIQISSKEQDAMIIEEAELLASELGYTQVGSEHLLLALVKEENPAGDCLRGFGLTQDKIFREMEELAASFFETESYGAVKHDAPRRSVWVCRLPDAEDLPLPEYQTEDAAGLDLLAAVPADEPFILKAGAWGLVPTGLRIAIPRGYEGQVRPRSGLALKHGIGVLNSPGTIDADYRGEVRIILFNFSGENFTIRRGERIAQLVLSRVIRLPWVPVDELPDSTRGEGGFGHTGR